MCQCRMAYNMVVLMLKNVVWDKWMNDQLNSLWVAAAAVCVCHSIFRCYRYTLLLIQCLCVCVCVTKCVWYNHSATIFFVCPPTMKSCLFIVWIVVVNGDYFDDDDVFFQLKKSTRTYEYESRSIDAKQRKQNEKISKISNTDIIEQIG